MKFSFNISWHHKIHFISHLNIVTISVSDELWPSCNLIILSPTSSSLNSLLRLSEDPLYQQECEGDERHEAHWKLLSNKNIRNIIASRNRLIVFLSGLVFNSGLVIGEEIKLVYGGFSLLCKTYIVDLFVFGWNILDKLLCCLGCISISRILLIYLNLKPIQSIVFILNGSNFKSSSNSPK